MPSSLLPCSQMSSTTSCGRRWRTAVSAPSLSAATLVSNPSSRRMPAMRSRISSSSSTIRISDAICNPCLLIPGSFFLHTLLPRWKCQYDLRSRLVLAMLAVAMLAVASILQDDLSAMVFHDLADDRQAEARALGPRRNVRLGQSVSMFVRQADTVVGDAEDHSVLAALQRNSDTTGR